MRTMSVVTWRVRKPFKRKDNPPLTLTSLPDNAGDFIDVVEAALRAVKEDDLVDAAKSRYVVIRDVERASGHPRVLITTVEVGRFGEPGRNRHVTTHDETYAHGKDEAPTVDVRVVFVVPEHGRMAVMFSERAHPSSVSTAIVMAVKNYWKDQPWSAEWSLKSETLVQVEAWLEQASVRQVQAVKYGHQTDYSDLNPGTPIGDMTYTLVPSGGNRYLKRTVWDLLRTRGAERAKILGLEGEDDLDEVMITVGNGEQVKTFAIDAQKTPSVRYVLGDLEADVSKPNHLVSRCIKECPGIYADVGVEWHAV